MTKTGDLEGLSNRTKFTCILFYFKSCIDCIC